jgi:hypothetical protein
MVEGETRVVTGEGGEGSRERERGGVDEMELNKDKVPGGTL